MLVLVRIWQMRWACEIQREGVEGRLSSSRLHGLGVLERRGARFVCTGLVLLVRAFNSGVASKQKLHLFCAIKGQRHVKKVLSWTPYLCQTLKTPALTQKKWPWIRCGSLLCLPTWLYHEQTACQKRRKKKWAEAGCQSWLKHSLRSLNKAQLSSATSLPTSQAERSEQDGG